MSEHSAELGSGLRSRFAPATWFSQNCAFRWIFGQDSANAWAACGVIVHGWGVHRQAFFGLGYYFYLEEQKKREATRKDIFDEGDEQTFVNWSGTHQVTTRRFLQPENIEELERLVMKSHVNKAKLRVMGAGLSPNGIGHDAEGMLSLALMDKVLYVDNRKCQVTVQAGARVSQVLEALKPHGLTLQNLASINEQQIGGFVQVSSHGTGATLPPVDEQVVGITLVTPGQGTLRLHRDDPEDAELMSMCRVGIGALGVVADVTLQCVPYHTLVERTWVSYRAEVERDHAKLLASNRHIRYMWIPYTDRVVVVASNPALPWWHPFRPAEIVRNRLRTPSGDDEYKTAPMRALLVAETARRESGDSATVSSNVGAGLSIPQLRDALLRLAPLEQAHVRAVNAAEADCWQRAAGVREAPSEEVLGFECGGQQWVSEVAFPAGRVGAPDGRDLDYMRTLTGLLEAAHVPSPAPIEQRWTCASSSRMSPAHGQRGDELFSWVGIIMYLPEAEEDLALRPQITAAFKSYKELCREGLWGLFGAHEHWAKIEAPEDPAALAAVRSRLAERFPAADFIALRRRLDPHNILANHLVNSLFPIEP